MEYWNDGIPPSRVLQSDAVEPTPSETPSDPPSADTKKGICNSLLWWTATAEEMQGRRRTAGVDYRLS